MVNADARLRASHMSIPVTNPLKKRRETVPLATLLGAELREKGECIKEMEKVSTIGIVTLETTLSLI